MNTRVNERNKVSYRGTASETRVCCRAVSKRSSRGSAGRAHTASVLYVRSPCSSPCLSPFDTVLSVPRQLSPAHNAVLPREINDATAGDVTDEQRRVIRSTECVQCVIRQRCRQLPLTDKPNRRTGRPTSSLSPQPSLDKWDTDRRLNWQLDGGSVVHCYKAFPCSLCPAKRRYANRSCVFRDFVKRASLFYRNTDIVFFLFTQRFQQC